jgi:hypothetical protein
VRASLPIGVAGVVDGQLPAALPPPAIARWPSLPFLVAALFGILCVMVDFGCRSLDQWRRRAPATSPADAARDGIR